MIRKKIKKNKKGFIILFAVVISSILLAIGLGVMNIALKEINFSVSSKDTNDAFFAADTGVECALFAEKTTEGKSKFPVSEDWQGVPIVFCLGFSINAQPKGYYIDQYEYDIVWNFVIGTLGEYSPGDSANRGCAKVSVNKRNITGIPETIIISKGYNKGSFDNPPDWQCNPPSNSVERVLKVIY